MPPDHGRPQPPGSGTTLNWIPALLPQQPPGLIVLSGCPQGELAELVARSDLTAARASDQAIPGVVRPGQLLSGTPAKPGLWGYRAQPQTAGPGQETGVKPAATGNVHYHIRERHRLQDCLMAVRHCKSLEETHRERRANSEFYLRPLPELEVLFRECPEALANTAGDRRTMYPGPDQRPRLRLSGLSGAGGPYAGKLSGEAVL